MLRRYRTPIFPYGVKLLYGNDEVPLNNNPTESLVDELRLFDI